MKQQIFNPKVSRHFQSVDQTHDFNVGDRVFNQKFGYGIIESMDGINLKVNFEKAETKNVRASFLVHEDDV